MSAETLDQLLSSTHEQIRAGNRPAAIAALRERLAQADGLQTQAQARFKAAAAVIAARTRDACYVTTAFHDILRDALAEGPAHG